MKRYLRLIDKNSSRTTWEENNRKDMNKGKGKYKKEENTRKYMIKKTERQKNTDKENEVIEKNMKKN